MSINPLLLVIILSSTATAAIVAARVVQYRRGRTLVRPATRRERRRDAADARRRESATVVQTLHDGIVELERIFPRTVGRSNRLPALRARAQRRREHAHEARKHLHAAEQGCADTAYPPISQTVASVFAGFLILGDMIVIAGVMLAVDPLATIALAVIKTLAFSVSMFLAGKALGWVLVTHWSPDVQRPLARPAAMALLALATLAITGCAAALGSLLVGHQLAWTVLIATPALGSALLTACSFSSPYKRLATARRANRRAESRLTVAEQRLSLASARAGTGWARIELRRIASLLRAASALVHAWIPDGRQEAVSTTTVGAGHTPPGTVAPGTAFNRVGTASVRALDSWDEVSTYFAAQQAYTSNDGAERPTPWKVPESVHEREAVSNGRAPRSDAATEQRP